MKNAITMLIALAILFTLSAALCLGAGDAAAGKDMFLKKCKMCHGEDGAGTPAMLKKYGEKMKPLGSPAIQGMKDPEMAKAVKEAANHKSLAKALTDKDVDNLVAHIRTLKK